MNERLTRWTSERATADRLLLGELVEPPRGRITLKFLWSLLLLTIACGFTSAYIHRSWTAPPAQGAADDQRFVKNTDAWLDHDDWLQGTADLAPPLPEIIYEHPELCSSLYASSAVLAISTRAASVDIRTFARKILRPYIMSDVNVLFVLGGSDHELNEKVAVEANAYRDILVGGYVDSDANLENGGHPLGLSFSARCAATPLKGQAHVAVTERTLLNYRELSALLSTLAGASWGELLGAPGTEHLRQLDDGGANNTSTRSSGGVISQWVTADGETRAASGSFIAPVTATPQLVSVLKEKREACWGSASASMAAKLLSADIIVPILQSMQPEASNDTTSAAALGEECAKSARPFRQLLAEAAVASELMLITTERFYGDGKDVCGGKECQCKDWLTATIPADGRSAIPYYALLYEDCKEMFQTRPSRSAVAQSGIAGTPSRGPPIPEYTYDTEYCDKMDGAAAVMLTRSDDFALRKKLREWHKNLRTKIKLVFPVGMRAGKIGERVQKEVDAELKEHGDLILGEYHDYYNTLSTKVGMMMSWADECSKANSKLNWIIKCDADMTPNLPLIERLLDQLWAEGAPASEVWPSNRELREQRFRPQKYPFWMGYVWNEGVMSVIANAGHRNYEDLNLTDMPRYTSGVLYILSTLAAKRLAAQRLTPPLRDVYFRNEDAMVGMLVADMNANRDVQFFPEPGESKLGRELLRNEPDIPLYPFHMPTLFNNFTKQSPAGGCKGSGKMRSPAECDCHKVIGYPTPEARKTVEKCDWANFDAKHLPPLELRTETDPHFTWPQQLYNVKGRGVQPLPPSWLDQFEDADALLKRRKPDEPSSTPPTTEAAKKR